MWKLKRIQYTNGSNIHAWKIEFIFKYKGFADGVLKDVSKTSDTIIHRLAKLHAYWFSKQALAIIYDYFSNKKQKIKINNVFSS